MFLMMRWYVDT